MPAHSVTRALRRASRHSPARNPRTFAVMMTVDMKTGHADLRIRKADAVSMLDDLHRGKGAGKAWGWLIDMTGVLLLVLSLIGYVLFFTMRSRLRTALVLTGLSVAALAGLFVFFVP